MLCRRLAFPCLIACLALACTDAEVAKARHLERARAHVAAGEYDKAVLEYRNVLKADQRHGEARYELAEALARSERPLDAAREYVRAAELLADRADVQIKAGGILLAAREFQRAQEAAERALASEPANVDAQLLLAHALAGLKDLAGAVREIEEAINLAPADSRPYTSLGGLRLAEGDRPRAEAAYRRAIEIDPKSVAARIALGYFYWSGNARASAVEHLNQAVALDPADLLANRTLAYFHLTAGEYEEAEPSLLRLAQVNDPSAMLTVADHYARTGRSQEARPLYERLRAIPASQNVAVTRLAGLDHQEGRREQAYAVLDEALQDSPNNAQLLAVRARLLMTDGRLDDAATIARQAVAADGNLAVAQYTLGQVLAARGQVDEAAQAFRETLRINPRAAGADLQLSRLSLAAGRPDAALRHAEAARKAQPDSPDARLGVAAALISRRQFAGAEAELKPLLAQFPESASVRATYGTLFAGRGNVAAAVREFDSALALDPHNLQALAGRTRADLRLKRPQDGRNRLARALEAAPNNAPLLLLAGQFEISAGDLDAAERHLRRAIDLQPSSLAAYQTLASVYLRQNRLDQARAEFENLAALRSDPVGPRTMIGIIYDVQNRPDEARKIYEETVKLGGQVGVAANNLAWHYAERGEQLNVALDLAQRAKQQLPNSHEVDDTLGWVYYKAGMADLAIPPLERSVKAAPQLPMYHYHLGLAYAKAGRHTEARRALEHALSLDTDFPGADEAREALASLPRS